MQRNTFLNRLNPFSRRAAHSTNRRRRPFSSRRRLSVEALEQRNLLAVFTVTSDADTVDADKVDLTLREAILEANAKAGTDTIDFSIANPGPHTIQLESALPTITDPVIIDGYTQLDATANTNPTGSGLNTNLMIELDGSAAGDANGLIIHAGNSTIRGLAINRFARDGIRLASDNNVIEGNFIGTNVTGTAALGNGKRGLLVYGGARSNVIGTDGDGVADEAERNIISGNITDGVEINGAGTDFNVVAGNHIGTDVTGTAALGNGKRGVLVDRGARSNVIGTDGDGRADEEEGNVVSGNISYGVNIHDGHENVIAGNFIGTDLTGMQPLGNGSSGVIIQKGAQSNWIGTDGDGVADEAERNVISGNATLGVQIQDSGTAFNSVAGNLIGTDVSGFAALPNSHAVNWGGGILVFSGASANRIGTNSDGLSDEYERNVISGNASNGMRIYGMGTDENLVSGNYIGTDVNGTGPLGNKYTGVRFAGGASNNLIGGESGNTIAFNGSDGVNIGGGTTRNAIQGNSIHSNGDLGIDLYPNGVTLNDMGDVDVGPNNLQNFPLLSEVDAGANTRVAGTLNSTANTTFTIDVYANTVADPSGYGEGERFLGSFSVVTDGTGNVSFDEVLVAAPSTGGEFITATATDPNGNTSEFSGPDANGNPAIAILPVQIDIKPGSDPNSINLKNNGVIAVAIFTTADFDASGVDVSTVVFADAFAVHSALEDVDDDGDLDLILHFRTQDTSLLQLYEQLLIDDEDADGVLDSTRQATDVKLEGETVDSALFDGSDEVDLFFSGKALRQFLDELFG